jgi:hypothetical protein
MRHLGSRGQRPHPDPLCEWSLNKELSGHSGIGAKDLPSRLFKSIRSFFTGEMLPFELVFARASKLGGNLSSGRTKVCTVQGNDSGGVGSSIWTVKGVRETVNGRAFLAHCWPIFWPWRRRSHVCSPCDSQWFGSRDSSLSMEAFPLVYRDRIRRMD